MSDQAGNKPFEEQGDETALMLAAAAGSEAAYFLLVRRLQRPLLNLYMRLGAHHDEAEDAAQDTFLRLLQAAPRYKPMAPFRAFFFRIARNAWMDFCRSRQRREKHVSAPGGLETSCHFRASLAQAERMELTEALSALSDAHRQVLVFSIYGGLSYSEIAAVMTIPEGTVKSRAFHALRQLRASMGAHDTAISF
ncbi:MAG: RNA polymerase sigma factor [Planctomycetes bacterium]|nr:RNA polymerase sigma factor [Planctomycetota bacterium]